MIRRYPANYGKGKRVAGRLETHNSLKNAFSNRETTIVLKGTLAVACTLATFGMRDGINKR